MSAFALLNYQKTGAAFLAQRRYAALFDEMGVGKTAQAVHAANLANVKHALVLSPHIGMVNWQREIAMWGQRPGSAILSNRMTDAPVPWHIINYDLFQEKSEALRILRDRRYELIIADECQALKNHGAARTTNVLGRNGIARNSDRVWLVSGSPCPNHVGELYPALLACFPQVLQSEAASARPDRLMSYDAFLRRYCIVETDERGHDRVVRSKGAEIIALKDRLRPHMLRRTLKEVLPDLPPLRFSTVTLDPRDAELYIQNSPEQRELLNTLRAAMGNIVADSEDDAFLIALEQMETEALSTQRRLYGEAKVPLIADMIHGEVYGGLTKLVVFYHHQSVGAELCRRLYRLGVARIDGSIAKALRQPIIDDFQSNRDMRVLLISLDCGSTVITLTAAAHVLFAEPSWTPYTNVQAARRCSRLGQTRPVLARFAALAGSLDEIIIAVQARKARGLAYLFSTSDDMEETNAFRRA